MTGAALAGALLGQYDDSNGCPDLFLWAGWRFGRFFTSAYSMRTWLAG